jgi:hypothetical protein
VIGATDRDEALAHYPNVEISGSYNSNSAVSNIVASRCAVALFLSVTPETYCFALSEALLAGLVPVAFDLGAVGERLRALKFGHLLPPQSPIDAIVGALREAAALSDLNATPVLLAGVDSVYADLFADYYSPLLTGPETRGRAATAMVGPTSGVFPDLWCSRRFELAVQTVPHLREIELLFWCHEDHLAQGATTRLAGVAPQRVWLESGAVTTMRFPTNDPSATLHRMTVLFDFSTPLRPPDRRRGAAKLVGLVLVTADGERVQYRLEGEGLSASSVELSLARV